MASEWRTSTAQLPEALRADTAGPPDANGEHRLPTAWRRAGEQRILILGSHLSVVLVPRHHHDMRELQKGFRQLAATTGRCSNCSECRTRTTSAFNFLAAHDCGADLRAFRHGTAEAERPPRLPSALAKAAFPSESKSLASAG